MATLDKVMQLQSQGMSDMDIANQLKKDGISPTEINDSINQAKIKMAVSPPDNMNNQQGNQNPNIGNMPSAPMPSAQDQNMSAPMPQDMQAPMPNQNSPEMYPPQGGYNDPYAGQNYQQQYQQDPYGGQQGYEDYYQQTPQAYSDQGYYQGGGAASSENISEIAEQVVAEKLNEYKKKVGDIVSFKNTIQDKVNNIDDRLKRIEATIDKLQQSVVGKIGEFGETSAAIHKDLENLHGTVGKLMNPLVDAYKEAKKK